MIASTGHFGYLILPLLNTMNCTILLPFKRGIRTAHAGYFLFWQHTLIIIAKQDRFRQIFNRDFLHSLRIIQSQGNRVSITRVLTVPNNIDQISMTVRHCFISLVYRIQYKADPGGREGDIIAYWLVLKRQTIHSLCCNLELRAAISLNLIPGDIK